MRIFTAEFVRAQPERVAEILDRCFYALVDAEKDLLDAERRREREVEAALALAFAHKVKVPRGLPQSLQCSCGKPKQAAAKNCRECYERSIHIAKRRA